MANTSVVGGKGQITIAQQIRLRLGLKKGDRVEFVTKKDLTILRPLREGGNPFQEYVGALAVFRTRKEIHAWISELRDE